MKKLLLAILTLVYMTASSGIAMEIHYCMGKRAGVEFYGSTSDRCSKCGMKAKKNGCCTDEHKFYKLSDSHKNVLNDLSFATSETVLTNDYNLYHFQLPVAAKGATVHINSPPDIGGPSINVRNCVFRI
jgi:hypothetical protein